MPFIEGYLDRISAAPGEVVRLHASSDLGVPCALTIIREGSPERVMRRVEKIDIGHHAMPGFENEPWLHGPRWPACWELTVPGDWPSGVYRLELSHALSTGPTTTHAQIGFTGWSDHLVKHDVLLIVRAARPASVSKILLQLTTNTYAAYNNWGGKSVYAYNSHDKIQAPRVTLLRPGLGYYSGTFFTTWERPFIHWCDREGITLEYAANEDLAAWPAGFDGYRLVLSVGHDEYWSAGMRDNLEAFIARGGNAAFFSGNSVFWQVRFEDGGTTMVTYKEHYKKDPVYTSGDYRHLSTVWSHPLVNRPENLLTGVSFRRAGYHRSHDVYMDGSGAYTVRRSDDWVFAGTGLKNGDEFGGSSTIVGYETDGCGFVEKDGYPVPTGEDSTPIDFKILALAPAGFAGFGLAEFRAAPVFGEMKYTDNGFAMVGYHSPGNGAGTVFTAGTTDWSHGLAKDPIVGRITRNVIDRLSR